LRIQDGKEEGIYVFNPVSSWFPIGENADGFEFNRKAKGDNAIDFRRSIRRVDKSN
jgi:hypothetical protein